MFLEGHNMLTILYLNVNGLGVCFVFVKYGRMPAPNIPSLSDIITIAMNIDNNDWPREDDKVGVFVQVRGLVVGHFDGAISSSDARKKENKLVL